MARNTPETPGKFLDRHVAAGKTVAQAASAWQVAKQMRELDSNATVTASLFPNGVSGQR